MATIETESFYLPSHYACALINSDSTGLSDEEEQKLDEWIDVMGCEFDGFYCVGCSDESEFRHSNSMDNLGADCLEFQFHVNFVKGA